MKFPEDYINTILQGDSFERIKEIPENSVDLLVTDPPYGYSFMGKSWDKALPSVDIWKECLRVLKPGAFAFIMSAPRSDVLSRMIVRIEDAGFRVNFSPIYWTYASGFPKAMNIGKMVDKRMGKERTRSKNNNKINLSNIGPAGYKEEAISEEAISEEAKLLNGSYGGFQPKPAVEVIIVAMKPLSEKTFVDQALKNGKGVTWFDDGRIPITDNADLARENLLDNGNFGIGNNNNNAQQRKENGLPPVGRFPANLLVSDDVLNDGRIRVTGGGDKGNKQPKANNTQVPANPNAGTFQLNTGSYSRYFDLDAWAKTLPFLIVPKASKGEKDAGLEAFEERQIVSMATANGTSGKPSSITEGRNTRRANHHPTVKPLKLMSYLITLGSRTDDIVLDPFAGSGTTPLAAHFLKRKYIGIEREKEYCDIAQGRLKQRQEVLL